MSSEGAPVLLLVFAPRCWPSAAVCPLSVLVGAGGRRGVAGVCWRCRWGGWLPRLQMSVEQLSKPNWLVGALGSLLARCLAGLVPALRVESSPSWRTQHVSTSCRPYF